MSMLTKKTAKLLCFKSAIAKKELGEEAQKLVELAEDPTIPDDQKRDAIKKLDLLIERLQKKVETEKVLRNEESS